MNRLTATILSTQAVLCAVPDGPDTYYVARWYEPGADEPSVVRTCDCSADWCPHVTAMVDATFTTRLLVNPAILAIADQESPPDA